LGLPAAQAAQTEPLPIDALDKNGKFTCLAEYRDKIEKDYLQMLLNEAKGSRKDACRLSGMSQSRLYGLLKKHNLSRFGDAG
jgi:transcriptional regulator with AAA-type ATPase domain